MKLSTEPWDADVVGEDVGALKLGAGRPRSCTCPSARAEVPRPAECVGDLAPGFGRGPAVHGREHSAHRDVSEDRPRPTGRGFVGRREVGRDWLPARGSDALWSGGAEIGAVPAAGWSAPSRRAGDVAEQILGRSPPTGRGGCRSGGHAPAWAIRRRAARLPCGFPIAYASATRSRSTYLARGVGVRRAHRSAAGSSRRRRYEIWDERSEKIRSSRRARTSRPATPSLGACPGATPRARRTAEIVGCLPGAHLDDCPPG